MRELVAEPSDQHIDLFWARLLPYLTDEEPAQRLEYRLLPRTNLQRRVLHEARLLAPAGWEVSAEFHGLELDSGARGEVRLVAVAPASADNTRRLLTAEIKIDGDSQGQVSEALVTVRPQE